MLFKRGDNVRVKENAPVMDWLRGKEGIVTEDQSFACLVFVSIENSFGTTSTHSFESRNLVLLNNNDKSDMTKHYKVLKDNFLWDAGAILKKDDNDQGYRPIDEIFCKSEKHTSEYITAGIVEDCPDYFERVYGVNLLTKTVYKTKEEAKELLKEINKGV